MLPLGSHVDQVIESTAVWIAANHGLELLRTQERDFVDALS